MEERLRSSLLDSPLYGYVQTGWLEWQQGICSVQLQEEDFMLYLLWSLDQIKEKREAVAQKLRAVVFKGVRDRFIDSQFQSNQSDIEYVSNLVCACSLYCFGLVLTGNFENQDLYVDLLAGLGDHKDAVMGIHDKIEVEDKTELKEWLVGYMDCEEYYTSGEKIEWLEEELVNLPDIARITRGPVQIMQVNIEQFNNAPGATFTDKSLNVKIEGDYGEHKSIQ